MKTYETILKNKISKIKTSLKGDHPQSYVIRMTGEIAAYRDALRVYRLLEKVKRKKIDAIQKALKEITDELEHQYDHCNAIGGSMEKNRFRLIKNSRKALRGL